MGAPRDHKFRELWQKTIRADEEVLEGVLCAALLIGDTARVDGTRALMSNRQLASFLGVTVRTAIRRTQYLRDLGYLELAERGGHRGDGTVAANVYELSLPSWMTAQHDTQVSLRDSAQHDTQVSLRDSAQHDTQVSPWDESQSDNPESQSDNRRPQSDNPAPQSDTQVSHPSLNPSLYPSPNPSYRAASSAVEAAVVNAYSTTRVSSDGTRVGIRNLNQDQKQERLKEGPRCKTCYAAGEANHDRMIENGYDPHPFIPGTPPLHKNS